MDFADEFPNARLRWMDDLLAELEAFARQHDLHDLSGDLGAARLTLRAEAERISGVPNHPINRLGGHEDG